MKKKPITHADALRYICEQLGTPDDSERCRAIQKHLAGCTDCTHELGSLRRTVELFKGYPEFKPSPAAKKRLRDVILEARSEKQEARSEKQEARSKKQEARSKKQEAKSKKQKAKSKKR